MERGESVWSYTFSALCQEELTCLNLESAIRHSERRLQGEDRRGTATEKTAVHKHVYDSYCRVNKRAWCHQESKLWGNFIYLQKEKEIIIIKKTIKKTTSYPLCSFLAPSFAFPFLSAPPTHIHKNTHGSSTSLNPPPRWFTFLGGISQCMFV